MMVYSVNRRTKISGCISNPIKTISKACPSPPTGGKGWDGAINIYNKN